MLRITMSIHRCSWVPHSQVLNYRCRTTGDGMKDTGKPFCHASYSRRNGVSFQKCSRQEGDLVDRVYTSIDRIRVMMWREAPIITLVLSLEDFCSLLGLFLLLYIIFLCTSLGLTSYSLLHITCIFPLYLSLFSCSCCGRFNQASRAISRSRVATSLLR